MNAKSNGPHLFAAARTSAPSNRSGVANCKESNCKILHPEDPPGGSTPTEPRKKATAIAVTGAPRSFPGVVFVPIVWLMDAMVDINAMFPHVSSARMMDVEIGTALSCIDFDLHRNIFLELDKAASLRR
mmetsp:Transcript_11935/g.17952  ORF Transcript_11935/g.17952 Transcript_11935/m.17952 type:complete len:129 (+) Transcript_11935:234-620(+)